MFPIFHTWYKKMGIFFLPFLPVQCRNGTLLLAGFGPLAGFQQTCQSLKFYVPVQNHIQPSPYFHWNKLMLKETLGPWTSAHTAVGYKHNQMFPL